MFTRLEQIKNRYDEINQLLINPEITANIKEMTELMKELSSLEDIVKKFTRYQDNEQAIAELTELASDDDEEISALAKDELEEKLAQNEQLEEEIKILLLPKDEHDDRNVIIEIRGAAGGDEANIFAGDLFRMYSRYAESQNWRVEVLEAEESEVGGFSSISFSVSGNNVYSYLKFESGPHRVQRVPATESQGRIHTSTATVLVMPEADEVEVDLDMNDVRFDYFCSSGPGGQSVNTTKSAVRATHIPTGIVASCQDGKSQHDNKASALKILRARLLEQIIEEQEAQAGEERLAKIGRGDRSEKIRTYNYPQNRVTDHRIGLTIKQLDRIIDGRLDDIIEALIIEDQQRQLMRDLKD